MTTATEPFRAVLYNVNRSGESLEPPIVRRFSTYDRADSWIETAIGQGLGNGGAIHEYVNGIGWTLAD